MAKKFNFGSAKAKLAPFGNFKPGMKTAGKPNGKGAVSLLKKYGK
mgnify:CR=1 FL=1|tara:strand:- start:6725 stop:6859 length:135 start_codon:yes stop_codon:yes gene_type:complete